MESVTTGLVTAGWLAERLGQVRVVDVRWYLPTTGKRAADAHAAGHIPGAGFIDLDAALADPDDGTQGRHPLPRRDRFVKAMRAAGISPGTHVVAYDDTGGTTAARLWWLLRAFGHAQVSLLDGGLDAWREAGGEFAEGAAPVEPGAFEGSLRRGLVASLDDVQAQLRRGGPLFDVRAAPRYRGETEPVDPRPGHIPGARSLPLGELMDGLRFKPVGELRSLLSAAGADGNDVTVSCGSGVTACHLLFALDHAGLRPFGQTRLYAGSYSEWSRRSDLPVMTGPSPGTLD
jgi:thiosulfate/3-mercaptopyruvate sulfurtransferase